MTSDEEKLDDDDDGDAESLELLKGLEKGLQRFLKQPAFISNGEAKKKVRQIPPLGRDGIYTLSPDGQNFIFTRSL